MIGYLSGTVHARLSAQEVIVLTGGVGYRISAPERDIEALAIGDSISFWTHHYVRDDGMELFGFLTQEGLGLFSQLITVSGVGPRMGLAILSTYTVTQVQQAIVHQDTDTLKSVSGVGKKTAERLVLELKDAMAVLPTAEGAPTAASGQDRAVVDALLGLGYSASEAAQALAGVDDSLTESEQIRAALQQLSSRG